MSVALVVLPTCLTRPKDQVLMQTRPPSSATQTGSTYLHENLNCLKWDLFCHLVFHTSYIHHTSYIQQRIQNFVLLTFVLIQDSAELLWSRTDGGGLQVVNSIQQCSFHEEATMVPKMKDCSGFVCLRLARGENES